ncbi:hypothetical protein RintRC_3858 [Richelia intracellularis]|nr:hypothetical protein RintRC_3858 [Richelia intracellularis]
MASARVVAKGSPNKGFAVSRKVRSSGEERKPGSPTKTETYV